MKKLLLRNIPLMLLLCALANGLTLANTPTNSKKPWESYQQNNALKTVLTQISNHYQITILFDESLVQGKTTSYKFNPTEPASIDKVMQELLAPFKLKAQKVNDENYVVISSVPKKIMEQSSSEASEKTPQETSPASPNIVETGKGNETGSGGENIGVTVKGRIISRDNEEAVPLANISVQGTKVNTISDAEGYFSVKLTPGARNLIISHVSFNPMAILVDTRSSMLVRMVPKANTLSNVVTMGIFRRPKENFTGAATSISGEELRQVNNVSVFDAIKVFEPSIRIPDNINFGSDPNRLPDITLRGTNNFPQQTTGDAPPTSGADFMANYAANPNQPLFILDGFEVSLQKIYDLDMTRIANFTILKDAAATSVYGSRAANGVIVVDTKQPKAGKLRVSYSGLTQITGPDLNVYNLTDAAEKLEVERLAGIYSKYADGIRPDADAILKQTYSDRLAAVQRGVNTYWLSQPVRTGFGQRHSLFLDGGDNSFRYGIDLSYNRVTGVMKNSDRNTYSGNMNFSYRKKGFLIKNVLSVSFNDSRNSNYGSFSQYSGLNPYWTPYDSSGQYVKVLDRVQNPITPTSFTTYYNPLYNTTLNTRDTKGYSSVINQSNLEWNIGKGVRISARLGLTKQNDESDLFLPSEHTSFANISDITKKGSYTKGFGKFFSYDGTLQLEYNKKIKKHQFFNTTGLSAAQTKSDYTSVYVEGFPNQRLDDIGFGNGYPQGTKPSGSSTLSRRVSGYSNINYSYAGRYQADLSVSADGSSQFGVNNQFAPFWSAGASWNLHKEDFLRKSGYFNQLRVRATIGTTGDSKFPPFLGITTYEYYTDQSVRGQIGAILKGYGNPDLRWQQTLKRNIGTDVALFQNRIYLTFDVYRENTKGLILDINTPPSVGFSSYRENVGEMENRGYEFKLNAFVIRNKEKQTNFSVFVNGSHNRNFIKKISNSLKKQNELNDKNDQTTPQFRFREGQSVNAIWAVRSLGIDPSNGREVYLDRNDSLTYVWSPLDKVIVGDAIAKLQGNFGSNFTWKGLTLGLYFNYQFGGQLYNQTLAQRIENANLNYNVDRRVLSGRWKAPGDVTFFKGLVDENGFTITTTTKATSRFVQKNNFINAASINLSYQLSNKLNKHLGLSNTRIAFTANDIKRWSSIEVERGLDYPFARNFTINISTQF